MNIGIFGSCVSRDTCEFLTGTNVVRYVARHSVTSLKSPHGSTGVNIDELSSAFQRKMVLGDLEGSGLDRITDVNDEIDVLLIDLADERRGYWRFLDGTSMTNSSEIVSCGAARDARRAGARLISFGSQEHFADWKNGFVALIDGLATAQMLDRTIFMDIEWAAAIEGAKHPGGGIVSKMGLLQRRTVRGVRKARQGFAQGRGVFDTLSNARNIPPTEAESFAERAISANELYARYSDFARANMFNVVSRSSKQSRINPQHKWGAEPFHFRDLDYKELAADIENLADSF